MQLGCEVAQGPELSLPQDGSLGYRAPRGVRQVIWEKELFLKPLVLPNKLPRSRTAARCCLKHTYLTSSSNEAFHFLLAEIESGL